MGVPAKDLDHEVPIPDVWRPALGAIVESLVRRDISIAAQVPFVDPLPPEIWRQCLQAVEGYGDVTLISLPDESWDTSVSLWYGDRWRCLIDLWTAEEGRSDLVLDVDIFEKAPGYRYSVNLVRVP